MPQDTPPLLDRALPLLPPLCALAVNVCSPDWTLRLWVGIAGIALVAVLFVVSASRSRVRSRKEDPSPPPDLDRRRGLKWLSLVGSLVLLLFLWQDVLPQAAADSSQLSQTLQNACWVGYDPLLFDPQNNPSPPLPAIRRDLTLIRSAGFSGVVTFGADRSLAAVPKIAREQGLSVIMGVWNPKSHEELLAAATERPYVTGYCVGHDRLDYAYSHEDLARAIRFLRSRTGLPVTTSEEAKAYDDRLAQLGDWLFPDVHVSLLTQDALGPAADVRRDVAVVRETVSRLEGIAKRCHRPLMLKMVTYPCAGADDATPDSQKLFYRLLLNWFRDPSFGPRIRVSFMVHSAFDAPWKTPDRFYAWDPHTGLLRPDGLARPAVQEILRSCSR